MKNLLFAILDLRNRAKMLSMIREGYTDEYISTRMHVSAEEVKKVRGKE